MNGGPGTPIGETFAPFVDVLSKIGATMSAAPEREEYHVDGAKLALAALSSFAAGNGERPKRRALREWVRLVLVELAAVREELRRRRRGLDRLALDLERAQAAARKCAEERQRDGEALAAAQVERDELRQKLRQAHTERDSWRRDSERGWAMSDRFRIQLAEMTTAYEEAERERNDAVVQLAHRDAIDAVHDCADQVDPDEIQVGCPHGVVIRVVSRVDDVRH